MTEKNGGGIQRKWVWILVGVVMATALLGIGAAVLSEPYSIGPGVTIDNPDGPTITVDETVEPTASDQSPQDNVIDLGPHAVFESDGTTSARVSGWDDNFLRLESLNAPVNLTVSGERPTVTLNGDADRVSWTDYAVGDGLDDLRVRNAQGLSVTLTQLPQDSWVVLDSDGASPIAKWTGSSSTATFDIPDGTDADFEIETRDAGDIFSSASPRNTIVSTTTDIDLSVDVDAPDDGQYIVSFVNAETGTTIGSDTITDSGTASVTWSSPPLGTNSWYVELGSTVSSDRYTFETPSQVEIRDELTQELLNDSQFEVDVSFFSGDGESIISRTTTDGIVNLSGLSPDRSYVISAEETNSSADYISRRIYLPDITEQSTVYLLNRSATDTVDIEFLLDDQTGEYTAESTRLIVLKPFENGTGSTVEQEYRQLSGDKFGAASGYSVELEEGVRYRLQLATDEGKTRELGHYQPERSEAITLDVGELEWNLPQQVDEDVEWDIDRVTQDDTDMIRVQINDSAQELSDLTVKIYQTDNESAATIYNETHSGPFGQLAVTQSIPAQLENVTSWTVEWEGQKNGETLTDTSILGAGEYSVGLPVDSHILALFSTFLIVFVSGFFSVRVSELGVVIVPVFALGLFALGWLPLPLTWILGALAMGVMVEFASRGGFKQQQ